jgi:hypothetical protein
MRSDSEIWTEVEVLRDANFGVPKLTEGERLHLEVLLDIRALLKGGAGR